MHTPPHARIWDRLYVLAGIISAVFIFSGVARNFETEVLSWATALPVGASSVHPWAATMQVFHGEGAWASWWPIPAVLWLVLVWAAEMSRYSAYRREPERAAKLPERVQGTAQAFSRPLLYMALPIVLYLMSGLALMRGVPAGDPQQMNAAQAIAWLHTHPEVDAFLPWIGLITGIFWLLFIVLGARVRAARLQAVGVSTFHLYEDLPQGAALGVGTAFLLSLSVLAWNGPAEILPVLTLLVICSMIVANVFPIVAESDAWRFFPLLLFLLIIVGDLFTGPAFRRETFAVWGFAFGCAVVMILVARVQRRSLYGSISTACAVKKRGGV